MMLDFQSLVDICLTACLAAVGYFYRQIVEEQKRDRQMINDIRVDLPKNYVSRDDLSSHLTRIETMLNKIFDRLEQKADK